MNIYSRKNPPNGFYVYAYIRSKDSETAKAGTPYYIGKGKDRRAWIKSKDEIGKPKLLSRIVIVEANLTEIGAFAIERRLIFWYGRKDIATGILRNKTDGGEGATGLKGRIFSDEHCEKISRSKKGAKFSKQHRLNLSLSHKGKPSSRKGFKESPERIRAKSEILRGIPKPKHVCPHCGKEGGGPVMKRYHYDNCKHLK